MTVKQSKIPNLHFRNMIKMNTKHNEMNKNIISIFFSIMFQLLQMKSCTSQPFNSWMFFMLLLCGVGPSYEKFFIVSVNNKSIDKSHTLAEGKNVFIILLMNGKGGFTGIGMVSNRRLVRPANIRKTSVNRQAISLSMTGEVSKA